MGGITQTSPTKLSEVMRMEDLADKSAEEVAQIWLAYHGDPQATPSGEPPANPPAGNKQRVGMVLSAAEWSIMQENAKKSPMFVMPLAKAGASDGQGLNYVTLLVQQQLPFTLITSLEEFKLYGAGAPAAMTITHYPELVDSKGVVLARGDIVNDKMLNPGEARAVMQLLRAFYTDADDYKMVMEFNHHPALFDWDKLLKKLKIQ